jgi:SAM-dependent methyltransferase
MTSVLRLLNVGGGSKAVAVPSYYAGFEHQLLDIDPKCAPDILCDARALATLAAGQFDAIYCSHNLEHYHAHDVPKVLAGFLHVLKPDGFAEIRVPDLDAVLKAWHERGIDIEDVLYTSSMGPVRVRDVIYGFGLEIERSGQDFYAHNTGFTRKSLARVLKAAGFPVLVHRHARPFEIRTIAFRARPTQHHIELLGLNFGSAPPSSSA